jgi:L-asparaginase II
VDAIRVTVRRADVVEATHVVHAATTDGELRGDAGLRFFFRSACKPLQAIPFADGYGDLDDDEIAIACASHHAEPEQLAAVRKVLTRADATVDDLENGLQPGRPEGKLGHNCSGKHAGMLALCRAHGWPSAGYRRPDHPVQEACRAAHCEAAEVTAHELAEGIDGCGVVTFALPLGRMAHAFARLDALPGFAPVARAMRAHPDLVGGPNGADYVLMRDAPGWLAKGGAEGLVLASGPPGSCLGVALKAEDGATRPLGPALAAFLAPLGAELPELVEAPIRDTLGERVGECRVAGT